MGHVGMVSHGEPVKLAVACFASVSVRRLGKASYGLCEVGCSLNDAGCLWCLQQCLQRPAVAAFTELFQGYALAASPRVGDLLGCDRELPVVASLCNISKPLMAAQSCLPCSEERDAKLWPGMS